MQRRAGSRRPTAEGTRSQSPPQSALHRRALRFGKDHLLRIGDLKVRPDVVFSRWRVAVFVDGCFWHGCPEHQRVPQRNREYWVPKLQANIDRDRRVDAALAEGGWDVVRVWEHEEVEVGTTRVVAALERRHRGTASASSRA